MHLRNNFKNILVYCRLVERMVTLAWPLRSNGDKINPDGIATFGRRRGLMLECKCAKKTTKQDPRSCRIIESPAMKDIIGLCHYDNPRCDFYVNFTEVYNTCTLTSTYANLPTLERNTSGPDMDALEVAFALRGYADDEIAPYFPGYFGEYIRDDFPERTTQLGGSLLLRRKAKGSASTRRLQNTPYNRSQLLAPTSNNRYWEIDDFYPTHSASAPVAGPSRITLEPVPAPVVETNEERQLRRLKAGQGVTSQSFHEIFKRCGKCRQVFMATGFAAHVSGCLGEVVID
ncbi:hypothetical protein FB45DRAFT_865867 [Roridomyces roridus]|uniref:Uncharacterized protein n=1 Tax=Roridomyces roridus TaxID=1738132 RepID=A0AAD7C0A4_9AGAR|nr:hypothetical protein FB45DRAFT_865867 [Roridomyces roridus]